MKKLLLIGIIVLPLTGCSSLTQKDVSNAKDATKLGLSVVQKACVMANAFLPRTAVAKWCNIADPYLDALDDLLPAAAAAYRGTHSAAGAIAPKRVTCEAAGAGAVCTESP